ncbi:MAG: HEPN domain-containing protein [Syntrophobacteraceae bacterium]
MADSLAVSTFTESIGLAEALLREETEKYPSAPRLAEQKAVQGLRGGAAVLMVASFEYFLRQLFVEHIGVLTKQPLRVSFSTLPDVMQVHSIFETLNRGMKGPLFQKAPSKLLRLPDIDAACRYVISGMVNPEVFAETGNNPNSKSVKAMFSNVGIADIFTKCKSRFDRKWRKPTAQTFLSDKLDEIIRRRHVVAHTADALNISRRDLKDAIRFLKILVHVLDAELNLHIAGIR